MSYDIPNRRQFVGQTGAAAGAVAAGAMLGRPLLASEKSEKSKSVPAPEATRKVRLEVNLVQTGWNLYSTRFVTPPIWTWNPLPGASAYIVQLAHQDDAEARTVRLERPRFDMANIWKSIQCGTVDMLAYAVDSENRPICTAWRKHFCKSPPFDGVVQEPLDWESSIHRAVQHLLQPASDLVEDFERGLPRSLWSCCEDSLSGQRRLLGFPALHHPSFIFAFLLYADAFPEHDNAGEARRQARQYADWLLANHLPSDYRCSKFPYSTIEMGRTYGYIEGRNITVFRAARVGEAMVAVFRATGQQEYLDYAIHIADVYLSIQRDDGSWPYRVDPQTGSVVEEYTSNAVSPARLFALLEQIKPNSRYSAARERAVQWTIQHPVRTKRWQGMYEDVGESVPYRNLQHWDIHELIAYIVHFHSNDTEQTQIAEALNDYVEDQFVIWQTGDEAVRIRCPTPTVTEQYTCYHPMEAHTATWVWSLVALHRATGKDEYLTKATNAANSIIRAQQPCGAYSTWGYDLRFRRPFISVDWPGANAIAVHRLLQLRSYIAGLPSSQNTLHPV